MKRKLERQFVLTDTQLEYLELMAEKHSLPDVSKALRCLVSYAMAEPTREDAIFEVVRCASPEECEGAQGGGR